MKLPRVLMIYGSSSQGAREELLRSNWYLLCNFNQDEALLSFPPHPPNPLGPLHDILPLHQSFYAK